MNNIIPLLKKPKKTFPKPMVIEEYESLISYAFIRCFVVAYNSNRMAIIKKGIANKIILGKLGIEINLLRLKYEIK